MTDESVGEGRPDDDFGDGGRRHDELGSGLTCDPGIDRPPAVSELIDRLTRAEKLRLVRGGVDPTGMATGYVPPVERLGVPSFSVSDGPVGIRAGEATAFPASIALAAAWDPDLARRFGSALAAEARAKGFDGVLAPGLNVVRVPRAGRNFEFYSEDPHLTARTAAATVLGVESAGVLATAKHFVANNQETDRMTVSAEVGERALRELYLPGFRAAVEAGAGAVMAAYNRVNGTHVTEHDRLLGEVLRGELEFEGVVMSDWWGVEDGTAAAAAGTDLEMPGVSLSDLLTDDDGRPVGPRTLARRWPPWLPDDPESVLREVVTPAVYGPNVLGMLRSAPFVRSLPGALEDGTLPPARLDEMVARLLSQYHRLGLLASAAVEADAPAPDRVAGECGTRAHRRLAEEVAVRGTVLLENGAGLLPLDAGSLSRVAVVGPEADRARIGGGGSSEVTPPRTTSPLAGIRERADPDVDVDFERGVRYGGRFPLPQLGAFDRVAPGARPRLSEAVEAAAAAAVAVVVVSDEAAEGADRDSLALPGRQDRLVEAVARTGTPTAVVLATSGPVEMPWLADVDAVVQAWYGGQEAGAALASVLFGDVDPGGRLPVTFGRAEADYPVASPARYPGIRGPDGIRRAEYGEGVFVGYRHFDAAGTEPLFPFGHGESYAAFDYRDLSVEASGSGPPASLRVTVENVAERPGREVVQAYAGPADAEPGDGRGPGGAAPPRPPRELAGYAALRLDRGEVRTVAVDLWERAAQVYDPAAGAWTVDTDALAVSVGRSSRDLRLTETVAVDE